MAVPRCQRCTTKDLACDHRGLDTEVSDPAPSVNHEDYYSRRFNWNWMTEIDKFRQSSEPVSNPIRPSDMVWLSTFANDPEWGLDIQWPSLEVGSLSEWAPMSTVSDTEEIRGNVASVSDPVDTTGAIYSERVQFVSLQLKRYPEMFYKRGQTPFLHRYLYSELTSPEIQDVLSACALYCGKNRDNETLVYQDISRKAWDLAGKKVLLQCPMKMLAYTQALLLYQIIRLFDGDIRQRADAESHELVLRGWTEQLQARLQQLPSTEGAVNPANADKSPSWKDWIYQESCRRTILTSYMLQGVYSFLKFGYDNVSCKVNNLSFIAQAALWNASSEYHWREVCKEKQHFQVTIREWDTAMNGIMPNDLDELGIVVLTGLKGLDITRQWLGRENLERWGL